MMVVMMMMMMMRRRRRRRIRRRRTHDESRGLPDLVACSFIFPALLHTFLSVLSGLLLFLCFLRLFALVTCPLSRRSSRSTAMCSRGTTLTHSSFGQFLSANVLHSDLSSLVRFMVVLSAYLFAFPSSRRLLLVFSFVSLSASSLSLSTSCPPTSVFLAGVPSVCPFHPLCSLSSCLCSPKPSS